MVSGVTMSNLIFLPHKHLWLTIKKLAKECRLPKKIAVPYIGKGGAASLHFRKGDILLCALTEANARNGVVCPEEIEKLQAKGVKVYIRENLHAKIYLLGRTAIVCSASLSDNSANYLDEAGAMTTDRTVTPGINQWFKERIGQPVTPEWLAQCKRAYRPPSSERPPQNGAKNETRRESLYQAPGLPALGNKRASSDPHEPEMLSDLNPAKINNSAPEPHQFIVNVLVSIVWEVRPHSVCVLGK